jgi:hypothetical protein
MYVGYDYRRTVCGLIALAVSSGTRRYWPTCHWLNDLSMIEHIMAGVLLSATTDDQAGKHACAMAAATSPTQPPSQQHA